MLEALAVGILAGIADRGSRVAVGGGTSDAGALAGRAGVAGAAWSAEAWLTGGWSTAGGDGDREPPPRRRRCAARARRCAGPRRSATLPMSAWSDCRRLPFSSDWRSRSVICRSSASSRWSRVTTDDWVAAGSSRNRRCRRDGPSGRPAAAPAGPGFRADRCRCSGVGCWRCAMAADGRAQGWLSRKRGDQTRSSRYLPHASCRADCAPPRLSRDESYCPVGSRLRRRRRRRRRLRRAAAGRVRAARRAAVASAERRGAAGPFRSPPAAG